MYINIFTLSLEKQQTSGLNLFTDILLWLNDFVAFLAAIESWLKSFFRFFFHSCEL